ncbi:B1-hordein-like [Lycium barbarum]|uniref:B1-hordein-like n=1 Tax=Lycium barbarum TaxID=112863 RepID=UPI00293E3E59|nr:B1-hordein-like [Lycium barbarum]
MNDSGGSEQNGLGLITVPKDEPEASEGRNADELIAQLMQQMANMQSETKRFRNLTNLSITFNTPSHEQRTSATIPLSFSPVDSPAPQPFPSNPLLRTINPSTTNSSPIPQQTISQHSNPQQAIPQPTNLQQAIPQQNNPQQANPQQFNFQQANPLPFTTPYVPQPSVVQTIPLNQTTLPTQSYQATQHVPLAHVDNYNMQYVPPVYVAEAQPFTTPLQTMPHPEVDPYEEI